MPGHNAYHAGQGCGQALGLIFCAGVGGQGRRHGITVHKDALVLGGQRTLWEVFLPKAIRPHLG